MPRLQIPEKLHKLADINYHRKFIVLIGGRSSGKTTGAAQLLLRNCQVFGEDLICLREFQTSIAQSVHKAIKNAVSRTGAQGITVLDNKIKVGDKNEIIFNGMARNPTSIKSAEDYRFAWVEEAEAISQESLDALIPTIRKHKSQIWFTANPGSSTDPFSRRFINPYKSELDKYGYYEDDLHLIIMCNWRDNPWHDEEQEMVRLHDFATKDRAEYDHIWEGAFNDHVEGSIIKAEWFDAAIDAHEVLGFKPRGQKILTHDPSDSGDPRAILIRHGSVILDAQENDRDDVNDACDWALDITINNRCDVFRWDCDGLGLTLKRQVSQSLTNRSIRYEMFRGSETVERPNDIYQPVDGDREFDKKKLYEVFKNQRAYCWWTLRDRFYNVYRAIIHKEYIDPDNLISISSDIQLIPKLRSEICRIPKKPNGNGLIQIMSKEEMKNKFKIESPNLGDCGMMSMATGKKTAKAGFLDPLPVKRVV